jgi:carbonic anhydrase/acetyltransferase-like protein (isoleucine patch superfamily)
MAAAVEAAEYAEHPSASSQGPHKITLGHGCVLQAQVAIEATSGPIVIGKYCILEDQCLIENRMAARADGTPQTLVIGDYCVIGARAEIKAQAMGAGCLIEACGIVGSAARLGDGCVVMADCKVPAHSELPAATVVYGPDSEWRQAAPDAVSDENRAKTLSRFYRRYMRCKSL